MAASDTDHLASVEIHPILEKGVVPSHNLWYVLSAVGDSPSMRIGHTCTHVPGTDSNGKLYFIGGANPSGAFAEACVLDLDDHTWDTVDCSGLKARYEHSAFAPPSHPGKIYVFGGADQLGSFNDIQVFDVISKMCSSVACTGTPPSPRTFHNGPCVGDRLIVYSGGDSGINPVGDRQVYSFDAASNNWSTINATGNSPKPRLGHLMVAVGNKIFVHGGMSGATFYDDLHVLDLEKNSWTAVKQKKVRPPGRTGHGAFVSGSDIYVFGGMNSSGALDDMYKLNTVTLTWTEVKPEGSPPHNRLDFATCVFSIKVPKSDPLAAECQQGTTAETTNGSGDANKVAALENGERNGTSELLPDSSAGASVCSAGESVQEKSAEETETCNLTNSMSKCELKESDVSFVSVEMGLVHGGTDTGGEIFEDCLVFTLRVLS